MIMRFRSEGNHYQRSHLSGVSSRALLALPIFQAYFALDSMRCLPSENYAQHAGAGQEMLRSEQASHLNVFFEIDHECFYLHMIALIEAIAALFIGLALGLIGGGGSILTVPVFVYLMGIEPVQATAYSLFVVGATSLLGSLSYLRQKLIDLRIAVIFGIPSILFIFITRAFILPAIPNALGVVGSFVLTKGVFLMLLFGVLMVVAAFSMIIDTPAGSNDTRTATSPLAILALMLQGAAVGVLTGMVGAGGGFLTIPVLIIFSRIKMKVAVGTSLFIAGIRGLVGFAADRGDYEIDWPVLLIFTAVSIVGILMGAALAKRVHGTKLKKAFGWFVLVMGAAVLAAELLA